MANALRVEAEDVGRVNAAALGRALARMDAAARAAVPTGGARAVGALVKATGDPDSDVREAAVSALADEGISVDISPVETLIG